MNILFISTNPFDPSLGGVERVTDKLCRSLLSKGYNCYYISYHTANRINISDIAVKQDYFPAYGPESPENIKFLQQYIAQNKIDVLINQNGLYEHSHLFLNTGNSHCKRISVIHNDPMGIYDHLWKILNSAKNSSTIDKFKRIIRCLLYPKIKLETLYALKKHFRFIKENSDYIVTLSPEYAKSLKRIEANITDAIAIPNPNTYDNNITSAIDFANKENIVLYVGRLDEKQKKISRLIKIWANLTKIISDWQLYIIGDGKDRDKLESLAHNYHSIIFTGQCEPSEYYKRAKIICLTSDFEGFGMCLTEGMQFGCIPIAFNCYPAVTDIIKPEITGEIVKAYDIKEYEKKLYKLIKDDTYRNKLRNNAIEHVKRFNIENILPYWIKIFEQ